MNVSIQTLGCKVNFAEMAELGDRLARAGFTVSEGDEQPDICVINSCTVTAQAPEREGGRAKRRSPQRRSTLDRIHAGEYNGAPRGFRRRLPGR